MNAILVLVVSAYLLSGFPAIRGNVIRAVPRRYRGVHEFARSNAARIMGAYLRGQLIMAATIGTLATVGLGLLGLPDFVVLGVLAGLFELVPMFGPILSAVPAVIVALFQPWPTVVWVIIFFLVVQQFESNWLGPRVTGHAVGLHPLGAMFALMVGFEIAGILGGLFAVPVAGVLWVFVVASYQAVMRAAGEPLGDVEADPQLAAISTAD
jgi:predicted PurR-regulated permease PerM